MAKRLILAAIVAVAIACNSTGKSSKSESDTGRGGRAAAAVTGHDATESALMSLGLDGRPMRLDLNTAGWKEGRVIVSQAHLLSDVLLLESAASKASPPRVHALMREGLDPRWVSDLTEPTHFAASENGDTILLLSEHYLHALETTTGRRALQFTTGALSGLRRPALLLPFTPTGGPGAQGDTVYIPSFGSPDNNKTIESFSLITGQRGWGYRSHGDIFTRAVVGGDRGDPKLYFVSDSGIVTCLDASNYGFNPAVRWEHALEGRVGKNHDMFLTPDGRGSVGGLYVVDEAGMVYCLDRITGTRRWVNATSRKAIEGVRVFDDLAVVRMKSGLVGFDAGNVVYNLTATSGPDAGRVLWIRPGKIMNLGSAGKADLSVSDSSVAASHMDLEFQGEVLRASCKGSNRMSVNGGGPTKNGMLLNGSTVKVGETIFEVRSRGGEPLWVDLPYERIVAKVGTKMLAANGTTLTLLDAWTGAPLGDPVNIPGVRMILTNTADGNIFAVGGDAVVYGFFTR